jgi:hypothetical protein
MDESASAVTAPVTPLTHLSDEERIFQSAAYDFALKEIGPSVREMDHEGLLKKELGSHRHRRADGRDCAGRAGPRDPLR